MKNYDIVVAGGGVAGCAAALAAKRAGKSVILIEKTLTLGGLGTIGLINLFVPMCDGRGKQIIRGMCDEFVMLSRKYGWANIPGEWQNGEPDAPTETRYVCRYSPNLFALALMEKLFDEGVDILFDTIVTGCEVDDSNIRAITILHKGGADAISAREFIDATGDADLCALSGAPVVQGDNYFTYIAFAASLESCQKAVAASDISRLTYNVCGGEATLYGKYHPAGMKKFEGVTGEEISEYVIQNQLKLLDGLRAQDPKTRDVITLPTMAQLRTTRHLDGLYTFTESDAFKHQPDSICLINDFDRRDYLYEIPLRALICERIGNLFAVGRCASASGYGWDVLRVIPPAILTGQAAGIAAARLIDERTRATQIDILGLQTALERAGVTVHFDDAQINRARNAGERVDIGHV